MLRILEVKVSESNKSYGDNRSVYISIVANESLCKKKYTVIAFHHMREVEATKFIQPYHVISDENSSNF